MRLAIFVNVIHSLDALHIMLVVNKLTNKNILTIHDAYLIPHSYNIKELFTLISENFILIHSDHLAFKAIFNRLASGLGSRITYEEIIKKLALFIPQLKETGRLVRLL